jgi:hypothetical protein
MHYLVKTNEMNDKTQYVKQTYREWSELKNFTNIT